MYWIGVTFTHWLDKLLPTQFLTYHQDIVSSLFAIPSIKACLLFLEYLYILLYLRPLLFLYMTFPKLFFFFGGWGNETEIEICQDLTSVSSIFWKEHNDICVELIKKKIQAFLLVCNLIAYFLVLCFLLRCLLRKWKTQKEQQQRVKKEEEPKKQEES